MNNNLRTARSRILPLTLLALLTMGTGLPAQEAPAFWLFYKFTPIADTGGAFFEALTGFPARRSGSTMRRREWPGAGMLRCRDA